MRKVWNNLTKIIGTITLLTISVGAIILILDEITARKIEYNIDEEDWEEDEDFVDDEVE